MFRAEVQQARLRRETDSAVEVVPSARFPARESLEQSLPSQPESSRPQAIAPAVALGAAALAAEVSSIAVAALIEIATEIVVQAARSAPAQPIVQAHTQMPWRKSRSAQPSAIAFASTSPSVSYENLFPRLAILSRATAADPSSEWPPPLAGECSCLNRAHLDRAGHARCGDQRWLFRLPLLRVIRSQLPHEHRD